MSRRRVAAIGLMVGITSVFSGGCTTSPSSVRGLEDALREYSDTRVEGDQDVWPVLPDGSYSSDLTLLQGAHFGYRLTFYTPVEGGSEWHQICVGLADESARLACGSDGTGGTDADVHDTEVLGDVHFLSLSGQAANWDPAFSSDPATLLEAAEAAQEFRLSE